MKKSTRYILIGAVVLLCFFYWNMYRNGSFNNVTVELKQNSEHKLFGKWVEGTFKDEESGNRLAEMQRLLIEDLAQQKISVFYEVNPRKDNQETFKAFVGSTNREILSKVNGAIALTISYERTIAGKQDCTPGFQKIHGQLLEEGQIKQLKLSEDSVYEEYSEQGVYVEMKIQ